ncbi:DUF6197 family protein [Paractinoplanes lichenicola]|uniref:Uncharacterized protein n=1 Tax=Paractinoplanes lichenicola TaxID=2802976 RepID=A0ABS1VXF1_9ACTN|nr:hypothetical protein [Actinoplanes lichenicola]MBL7259163.1 hypothetical protein [Actinoplanes lichenicola]
MNPTHNQDNTGPDTTDGTTVRDLTSLLGSDELFRAALAQAVDSGALIGHHEPDQVSPVLGLPMSDADRRWHALREAGYTGAIDSDGYARTEAEEAAWSTLMLAIQTGYLRGDGGFHCLTPECRDELASLDNRTFYTVANKLAQGVAPEYVAAEHADRLPWFVWESDEQAAEKYGETELNHDRISARDGFTVWSAQRTGLDGAYSLTEAGRRALDAPALLEGVGGEPSAWVAVRGWCEVCGKALPWVCTWDEPLCSDCVIVVPADNEYGSTVKAPDSASSTAPVDLVTETDDETTARVLRSAALYLERHGWIQGTYYDGTSGIFTPPACLVGAIGMVCYGGPVDAPAEHRDNPGYLDFEAAVLHLDRYLLAEDSSEAYEFNDARGRCLEDVTHVLREAALRPAYELIDALRAIDRRNADMAALAAALIPGGTFAAADRCGPDLCRECTFPDGCVYGDPADEDGDA